MQSEETLEDALKRAKADAAMLAMELHAKSRRHDALEGLARALQVKNAELKKEHAILTSSFQGLYESIKPNAHAMEAERKQWEDESALLREQVSIMRSKVKVHEEHAERSQTAMATMEQLFAAKERHADELRRGLEEELIKTREELQNRMGRELALMQDLKTYGEKFEQFKDVVKQNDDALRGYANDVNQARKEALEREKEKLEMSLQMQKANVQLIELVNERETLKARVKQLESQKNGLEKLSRTLTERLKQKTDTI